MGQRAANLATNLLGLVALAALGGLGYAGWTLLGDRDVEAGGADLEDPGTPTGEPAVAPSQAPEEDAPSTESAATPRRDGPLDWNNRALALLEEGKLREAEELFRRALEERPDVDTYANNLSEALFRRAKGISELDLVAALALLEESLEVLRDEERREQLLPVLERWRRTTSAEEGFRTDPSLFFTYTYDGDRDDLLLGLEPLKQTLDQVYLEYSEMFARRPVEETGRKIKVVFYGKEGFDRVSGLGDWAGGVFDGTIRVPVVDLGREEQRLERVLRHEVMHAFVHEIAKGKAPAWLNEGLAQWVEPTATEREYAARLARARLASAEFIPLSELRGTLAGWKDKKRIALAYDEALAFTDHLVRRYGDRMVCDMVAACAEGGAGGAEAYFKSRMLFGADEELATLAEELRR